MTARGVGIVLVTLAVGFAGGLLASRNSSHHEPAPAAIPWKNLPVGLANVAPVARAFLPPVPKGAPRCGRHVRLMAGDAQGVNSIESMYIVELENTARKACFVEGRPFLTIP